MYNIRMIITAIVNPIFVSTSNLTNVLRQLGALPFVALGMTFTTATATCGTGYETDAVLCVVVGGTSLKGGKGSVLRTILNGTF